jgi:hypothetical protein
MIAPLWIGYIYFKNYEAHRLSLMVFAYSDWVLVMAWQDDQADNMPGYSRGCLGRHATQ